MSKSANRTLIGAFVVGAVALAVILMIILGSGRFFSRNFINVMYFRGSVKGLNVGAPVMFRGVKVGLVKKIELIYDARDLSFLIPVYVEIDPDKMVYVGHKPGTQHTADLIRKGLRAQLDLQSLVTGQLLINLDLFKTDKPPVLMGLDKRYDEIPTIPTSLELFEEQLRELPIHELFDKILSASKGLDRLVNSTDTQRGIKSFSQTVNELKKTVQAVNGRIGPIMDNLRDSSENIRSASKNLDNSLTGEKGIPAQITGTLTAAREALSQADRTLRSVQTLVADKSPVLDDADAALEEVSNAARSLRFLTEYLEQHPESVITGKRP